MTSRPWPKSISCLNVKLTEVNLSTLPKFPKRFDSYNLKVSIIPVKRWR